MSDTKNGELSQASIRNRVKEIISNITGIPQESIDDNASFVGDLELDSLALLEIGVDVDYAYQLGVPEERLQELRTVDDAVALVCEQLAIQAAEG